MGTIENISEKEQTLKTFTQLAAENNIQRLDEEFLQRFLVGHQLNTYPALKAVCNFQSFINRRRERWLRKEKSRVEDILQSQIVDVLDKNGMQEQKVVWIRLEKWDPEIFTADEILEVSGLLCELAYLEMKDIKCIDVIIDCHHFTLKHLYALSRKFAKRMVFFISECLPMEVLHVYVVRQPRIFHLGYSLYKPFIEERLKKLIHICGYNYEYLLENVGRETLPSELHGTSEMLKAVRWLDVLQRKSTQQELMKSGYELYEGSFNQVTENR